MTFASPKEISYKVSDFTPPETEARVAPLYVFVYDIPYLDACGIFPPFRIINQIFSSGESGGGMSPGATWQPFTISVDEYNELVRRVENLDPATISYQARYSYLKFGFDPEFDGVKDRESWVKAACIKHRDEYHRALSKMSHKGW